MDTVQDEFFDLLTSGIPSSPLEQFLLNSLSEVSLKRFQKSFDLSCSDLKNLIIDQLQHYNEHIFYRVSELHSLSKW